MFYFFSSSTPSFYEAILNMNNGTTVMHKGMIAELGELGKPAAPQPHSPARRAWPPDPESLRRSAWSEAFSTLQAAAAGAES